MSDKRPQPQRSGSSSRGLNIRSLSEVSTPNNDFPNKFTRPKSLNSSQKSTPSPSKIKRSQSEDYRSFSKSSSNVARSASFKTPSPNPARLPVRQMSSDSNNSNRASSSTKKGSPTRSSSSKNISRTTSGELRSSSSKKNLVRVASYKSMRSAKSFSSSSEDDTDDDDESQTFTEAQYGLNTITSKGSYFSDDDESVYSRLSQDSFSIEDDDLDTTQ